MWPGFTAPVSYEESNVEYFLYTGTYTARGGRGIVLARFSPDNGRIEPLGLAAELENPSFLCATASKNILLAVSEVAAFRDERSGSVSSWKIDPGTGQLSLLSERASGGPGPCHVSLDQTESIAIVANYGDGSVAAFRIEHEGALEETDCIHRHAGKSINLRRQSGPHAHGAFVSPGNRYVVVPDLGADQLYVYSLDAKSAKLVPACPASIPVVAGTGPRHFVFDPRGEFGYLIGELNSTIVGFRSKSDGLLFNSFLTTPTIAPESLGKNEAVEIAIDSGGKFLYCSNRGADDIVVFAIGRDGVLSPKQRIRSAGMTPRHFVLDPTERFILVANQDSDYTAVFSRDSVTGLLNDTGHRMDVSQPACLVFGPNVC